LTLKLAHEAVHSTVGNATASAYGVSRLI